MPLYYASSRTQSLHWATLVNEVFVALLQADLVKTFAPAFLLGGSGQQNFSFGCQRLWSLVYALSYGPRAARVKLGQLSVRLEPS